MSLNGILAALALMASAPAAEPIPLRSDFLHADLPLFGTDKDQLWPMHFTDGDDFGCTSRFALGDRQGASTDDWRDGWLRFDNYGVFHCAYVIRSAHERDDLDAAQHRFGWMVRIAATGIGTDRRELWAMQIGAMPGSDYRLFAIPQGTGLIRSMEELQIACPPDFRRIGPQIDIWKTGYCAIPSREDLIDLAKRMAKLPPLTVWTLPTADKVQSSN